MRTPVRPARLALILLALGATTVLSGCGLFGERERLMCARDYKLLELNAEDCRKAGGQPVMARINNEPLPPPDASPKIAVQKQELPPPPGSASSSGRGRTTRTQ